VHEGAAQHARSPRQDRVGHPFPGEARLCGQQQDVGAQTAGEAAAERRQLVVGVAGRQVGVGVVARLVVVVFDVQRRHLRVVDAQGATAVVDVLAVEGLLGRLRRGRVRVLDQGLE
jgi:hypothetical protein